MSHTRWIGACVMLLVVTGLTGINTPAHAADDTARFYGRWETSFAANGRTVTLISVHDAGGWKN